MSELARKKLIVALDVDSAERALYLFEALSDAAGVFKIGMQLFTATGPDIVRQIVSRGGRVFLDLKYHDIPNTVAMAAIEATRLGVSLFNIHASGGREMMQRTADAVAEVATRENLAKPKILGVTVLTSTDQETLKQNGVEEEPAMVVSRLASLAQASGLDGVVASAQEIKIVRESIAHPDFLIVTPGIRAASGEAHDQRRTMTATEAIRAGADYLVIGRPILATADPVRAARDFVDEIDQALLTSTQPDFAEQSRTQSVQ